MGGRLNGVAIPQTSKRPVRRQPEQPAIVASTRYIGLLRPGRSRLYRKRGNFPCIAGSGSSHRIPAMMPVYGISFPCRAGHGNKLGASVPFPEHWKRLPETRELVLKIPSLVPKDWETVLEDQERVPKALARVTKLSVLVLKALERVLKTRSLIPEVSSHVPRIRERVPRVQTPIPGIRKSTPNICLFPDRLYECIEFSRCFTHAGSCVKGSRRSLASGLLQLILQVVISPPSLSSRSEARDLVTICLFFCPGSLPSVEMTGAVQLQNYVERGTDPPNKRIVSFNNPKR